MGSKFDNVILRPKCPICGQEMKLCEYFLEGEAFKCWEFNCACIDEDFLEPDEIYLN